MRFLLALLLIGGSALSAADQSWRSTAPGPAIPITTRESSPADFAVDGPATAAVGETVMLTLTGLPSVDLDEPIGDQIEWVDLLRFSTSCPSGTKVELEKSILLTVEPWRWNLRVTFTVPSPGTYVVACDWNQPPYGLALHRIDVGGIVPPAPDPPGPKPKPEPDDPVPPPTSGLHVIVVDDENERGLLPQSQINIFTSTKLVEWLDENCATASDGEPAYRFSSDDSLIEGEDARKLELPVWVAGWDSVMKAVKDGKIKLPAWAVSNGTKGVIEPLPMTVDAAIKRLEEFK